MRFASGASLDMQLRIPDDRVIASGISVDDNSDRPLSPCALGQFADLGVRYGTLHKRFHGIRQDQPRVLPRAKHETASVHLVDGHEPSAQAHRALPEDGYAVSRMRPQSDDIAGNWYFQFSP